MKIKLELGKIRGQFVTLPKVMVSAYTRPQPYLNTFWRCGQLYRGYWGIACFWRRFNFDFWWHHEKAEG